MKIKINKKKDIKLFFGMLIVLTAIALIVLSPMLIIKPLKVWHEVMQQNNQDLYYESVAFRNDAAAPKEQLGTQRVDEDTYENYTYYLYEYDYTAEDGQTYPFWNESDETSSIPVFISYEDPTDCQLAVDMDDVKESLDEGLYFFIPALKFIIIFSIGTTLVTILGEILP